MEKHVQGTLGINLNAIKKMDIKDFCHKKSIEPTAIPLAEAKQLTRKGCFPRTDFSSELADISLGGSGMSSWTFTILRTKKGQERFDNAVKKEFLKTRSVEEEKMAFDLLLRLSKRKQETAGFSI